LFYILRFKKYYFKPNTYIPPVSSVYCAHGIAGGLALELKKEKEHSNDNQQRYLKIHDRQIGQ